MLGHEVPRKFEELVDRVRGYVDTIHGPSEFSFEALAIMAAVYDVKDPPPKVLTRSDQGTEVLVDGTPGLFVERGARGYYKIDFGEGITDLVNPSKVTICG